ncbi:hypothetical protein ANN_05157 [Periplaneta americana]|uniref:Uncharacterized protein n=1 Tax=Periplaneta americana TaxID=6978 RepID=A0ABQ8TAC2_PERAM|nr:hypothetical protein ANN_05157 [Periplaneta americana]
MHIAEFKITSSSGDTEKDVTSRRNGPSVKEEWRKLHNAELHTLYSSPDTIRSIKSRLLRWAGHVARMGESRNAYRVGGKNTFGMPRRRWEDNIKVDLREVGYDGRDWINLTQVEVLESVPSCSDPNVRNPEGSAVSDTFIKYIEMKSNEAIEQGTSIKRRKKKLDVESGKSISAEDIENFSLPSTSKIAICSSRNKDYCKGKAVESSTVRVKMDIPWHQIFIELVRHWKDLRRYFKPSLKDIKRSISKPK